MHRLCLDSPERVLRAAVLDIVPTLHMYTHTSGELMLPCWHWPFMAHEPDLPERMMGAVPARYFMEQKLGFAGGRGDFFPPEALDEYVRCFPAKTIRDSCEDYRAAATVDLTLDTADSHRRVEVPLMMLWGGPVGPRSRRTQRRRTGPSGPQPGASGGTTSAPRCLLVPRCVGRIVARTTQPWTGVSDQVTGARAGPNAGGYCGRSMGADTLTA